MKFIKRHKWLFLILIVGGVLRFWRISDYGFFSADDADLLLPLKYYHLAISWCISHLGDLIAHKLWLEDLRSNLYSFGTPVLQIGLKPGQWIILAFVSIFLGVRDYIMVLTNTIFSLGIIWILYLFTKRIFDETTAILASFLFAISPSAVLYALNPKTITSGAFFVLFSSFLYLRAVQDLQLKKKRLFLAGFILGYSVVTNFINLFAYFVYFILELFSVIREPKPARIHRAKLSAFFFSASFIPFIMFEPLYWAAKLYNPGYKTYIQIISGEIIKSFVSVDMATFSPAYVPFLKKDLWFYPHYFIKTEGLLIVAAVLLGFTVFLINFAKKINIGNLLLFLIVVFPFSVLIIRSGKIVLVPRNIFPIFPYLMILAAYIISSCFKYIDKKKISNDVKRIAVSSIIIVFLINGLSNLRHVYKPPGYRQAAIWLKSNTETEDGVIAFFRWKIYQFYLDRSVYGLPMSFQEVKDFYFNKNYRYLVTDFNTYYYGETQDLGFKAVKPIEDKIKPIKLIDNPMATSEIMVNDTEGYGRERVRKEVMKASYADKIRIYDLKDYFGPKNKY